MCRKWWFNISVNRSLLSLDAFKTLQRFESFLSIEFGYENYFKWKEKNIFVLNNIILPTKNAPGTICVTKSIYKFEERVFSWPLGWWRMIILFTTQRNGLNITATTNHNLPCIHTKHDEEVFLRFWHSNHYYLVRFSLRWIVEWYYFQWRHHKSCLSSWRWQNCNKKLFAKWALNKNYKFFLLLHLLWSDQLNDECPGQYLLWCQESTLLRVTAIDVDHPQCLLSLGR